MYKYEKTLLFIFSAIYAVIGYNISHPTIDTLGMMGWLGLIQLVYCIISWMKRGNQIMSPYVIFLLALYLFSYGQSFLWALGIESEHTLIGFQGITVAEIFKAQVITLIMLAFFHIGALYGISKRKLKRDRVFKDYTNNLKQIGWILFAISLYPYVRETINDMILSMTMGYNALYEGEAKIGLGNLSGFIAGYFIPSIICLFIAYRENKFLRTIFITIISLNIVAILLTGGRSNAVILLAILLILYNYLVQKFTKKWIILGLVGAFLMLQVLAFVGTVRTEGSRTTNLDGFKVENNAGVEAVAEMGSTMFCLIKTMNLVPEKFEYRYGKSYMYSFSSLIPNLGFWDIHPAKREANLSEWLTNALGLSYGTGYSMCAEAYANFGYLGFILFFFWGWFIANVFGKIEISALTKNYALMAFLMILFWYFLKLPRNNFINIIRPLFFVAGPIYLYCTKLKFRIR